MTGLGGAAVGEILLLKIAGTAVRVNKVAQTAAPGLDGAEQRGFDLRHQSLKPTQ